MVVGSSGGVGGRPRPWPMQCLEGTNLICANDDQDLIDPFITIHESPQLTFKDDQSINLYCGNNRRKFSLVDPCGLQVDTFTRQKNRLAIKIEKDIRETRTRACAIKTRRRQNSRVTVVARLLKLAVRNDACPQIWD